MTKGELLEFLTKEAVKFRERQNFIIINKHLTGIDKNSMPSKEQIDGVLVAFINSVGMSQCIDYALSYKDFEKREIIMATLKDRVQPKQEWSEEDEKMYTATIFALAGFLGNEDKLDWLKSLKDRVQPKQEWSEEDETVLNNLIYALANDRIGNDRDEYVSWLKSLRPKPKQEWSERDKEEFQTVIDTLVEAGQYVSAFWLKSLKQRIGE